MTSPESITHVLYHSNCPDGFGSAYAAWTVLGDKAEYVPVRHGDLPPSLPTEARVAVVDFSYARPVLLELQARTAELIVLDHHRSAQSELEGLDFARFDLSVAGARMAWDFWRPGEDLPPLLAYVEDRDLWRWELPDSRAVSTALHCYPFEFQVWDALSVPALIEEGRAILRYQDQQIARAVSKARLQVVGGFEVPVVNSCLLPSEIGDELCRLYPDAPFAGVYYDKPDGLQAWSLRSIGEFDVAAVAKTFGGGGHRNAAGFARPT